MFNQPVVLTDADLTNTDNLTPAALALIEAKDDRTKWVFVPMTDWRGDDARAIREEIRGATMGSYVVKFAPGVNKGQKGTRMQLQPYEEWDRERNQF